MLLLGTPETVQKTGQRLRLLFTKSRRLCTRIYILSVFNTRYANIVYDYNKLFISTAGRKFCTCHCARALNAAVITPSRYESYCP